MHAGNHCVSSLAQVKPHSNGFRLAYYIRGASKTLFVSSYWSYQTIIPDLTIITINLIKMKPKTLSGRHEREICSLLPPPPPPSRTLPCCRSDQRTRPPTAKEQTPSTYNYRTYLTAHGPYADEWCSSGWNGSTSFCMCACALVSRNNTNINTKQIGVVCLVGIVHPHEMWIA